mgnify:CR=1 FL=1
MEGRFGPYGGRYVAETLVSTIESNDGTDHITTGSGADTVIGGQGVGQVVDVKRDANAVVQTAWLLPAAPLDRLEVVLVITDYEGGLPPVEQGTPSATRAP